MTNKTSVKMWAYRTIEKIDRFVKAEASNAAMLQSYADVMGDDEALIGVYLNSTTNIFENILFTDTGLYYFEGVWKSIRYDQINDVELAEDRPKVEAHLIRATTLDNVEFFIAIEGGEGTLRDVAQVLRYLMRITEK